MDSNQISSNEKEQASTHQDPTAPASETQAATQVQSQVQSQFQKQTQNVLQAVSQAAAAISALSAPAVPPAQAQAQTQTQPAPQTVSAKTVAATSTVAPANSNVITNKMPGLAEMPNVVNYLDFRKFLSDYYRYRREISKNDIRPYNYAVFSAAANIKSPNYLKLIIEGRRNLSEDMIYKFAKAMGLSKDQGDEFRLLVLYGQASDPAERNMHLKALNEKRVDSKLKSGEIDQKTWEKIPSWITWILYSLVDQKDMSFEPEKLRETLRNKASADEIQAALNTLIQAGELAKDPQTGEMKKARSLMESAEDVPVALVRKLQAELMYLGLESLFQDAPTEREFGSSTLALTKQEFEELRFQLRKLRKEAQKNIGVKRLTSKGERVYQLNLQLFPITK